MPFSSASRTAARSAPDADDAPFLSDCLRGPSLPQKVVPCKWLYDETGSPLFEQICEVDEYYPSRTEVALIIEAVPTLAKTIRPGTALIEFGSGASRKTRLLLDAVSAVTAYVPIDINPTELHRASAAIAAAYPKLALFPVCGDIMHLAALDPALVDRPRLGFFPGSTLGNFSPDEAVAFLVEARSLLGPASRLLLGIDLAKEVDILLGAYDDAAGVTAAFNLNLLARMNRELGSNIEPDAFEHRAVWNEERSRIEMHLVCTRDHAVTIGAKRFALVAGETIHTESSHKFSLDALATTFAASGWTLETQWVSENPHYALVLLHC